MKYHYLEDKDFIAELRQGNSMAYSRLIDEFQQKVFGTCLSFVPNTQDAEDITQEVFVEVYRSIQKFKGNAKLSTWIYRITTNKCLEFIRKKSTKKRFGFMQSIIGDMVIDKTSFFTEMKHPGVQLEQKELSETLYKAIEKLPEAQCVVFTLHKIDGKSYQEVAEITSKSVSSVESLMFRAKKNLKKILEHYYKNHE